jgi:hypothetical protein
MKEIKSLFTQTECINFKNVSTESINYAGSEGESIYLAEINARKLLIHFLDK